MKRDRLGQICTMLMLLIFLLGTSSLNAQVDPGDAQEAQEELAERDVSEEEIRKRLIERGFDPDNIEAAEIPAYEEAIEEIVAEIEAERANASTTIPVDKDTVAPETELVETEVQNEKTPRKSEKNKPTKSATTEVKVPPIYGHHLFREAVLPLYRVTDEIATPSGYILTTGDVLRISIFGASQADFESTVAADGSIAADGKEKLYVKGLNLQQARELVRARLQRRYRFNDAQFSMTLARTRNISINIFGEVVQPGTYSISAVNSGFNALVAAGGPTYLGSVRNMRLVKGSGENKTLDVYEYLTDPQAQFDYALDDQDIIFVPVAEKIVEVKGEVKRPMRYELRDGETLEDLIGFAGGLATKAYKKMLQVSRLGNDERILIDVPLQEYLNSSMEFDLQDGDIVKVREAQDILQNYVSSAGPVNYPGQYTFTEGMTLADLMELSGMRDLTRTDIVFVFRTPLDKTIDLIKVNLNETPAEQFQLQRMDRVRFFSVDRDVDRTRSISISGSVRAPDTVHFDPGSTIKIADLIMYAAGLKTNAHPEALLTRINPENREEKIYLDVNVFEAIADTSSKANLLLREGDHLTVYSNERYNELGEVSISGHVRNSTSTRYDPSLSLKDMLLLSGGLLKSSHNSAVLRRLDPETEREVEFIRFEIDEVLSGDKELPLQVYDEIRVFDKTTFVDAFNVQVLGEVKHPNKFSFDESLTLEDALFMSGGVKISASLSTVDVYRLDWERNESTRILHKQISLERVRNDKLVPKENIALEPYDIVIVRPVENFKLQEIVTLSGAVKFPGPYVLTPNAKLKDIIKDAGGIRQDGFAEGATLYRDNFNTEGLVMINLKDALKGGRENIHLRNGDLINIPQKQDIISIRTYATGASRVYHDSLTNNGLIHMTYQGRKSAKWYINNFSGGFLDKSDKNTVRVIEENGRVRGTKKFLGFIRNYPQMTPGGTIQVDLEAPEPEEKEREPVDWGNVVRDVFALLSSALTVIFLAYRINQ